MELKLCSFSRNTQNTDGFIIHLKNNAELNKRLLISMGRKTINDGCGGGGGSNAKVKFCIYAAAFAFTFMPMLMHVVLFVATLLVNQRLNP